MIFKFEPFETTAARRGQWRSWFAWHPFWVDTDTLVWLQFVWRRQVFDWYSQSWRSIYSITEPSPDEAA